MKDRECPICKKLFSKFGIKNHISIVHENKYNYVIHLGQRGIPWNKGLTKENDNRINDYSIKISNTLKSKEGKKHTEETKRKISEIRKKYLFENPDKVPYLLNHYSKGESYPTM